MPVIGCIHCLPEIDGASEGEREEGWGERERDACARLACPMYSRILPAVRVVAGIYDGRDKVFA